MAEYRLSVLADEDLEGIWIQSFTNYGDRQAEQYLSELKAVLELLVENPRMGREVHDVRKGVRRHEHRSHVIFYQSDGRGILVVRILPDRADWREHI